MRPQPHRLKWPLTPTQVEGLDEMLEELFKAVRKLSVGVPAMGLPTGLASLGRMGPPGSDGEEGQEGPPGPPGINGTIGVNGVPGAQGPAGLGFPGMDGQDGSDSIVPGPRGNDGGSGATGAQGPAGLGFPGLDGEDGQDGWPGPPGAAGSGGGGASGALVLVEQHTASNSAQLDFTTAITSTYDDYMVEFVSIILATDDAGVKLLCSTDGGASYDTSAIYDSVFQYVSTNNSFGSAGTTSQTFMDLSGNSDNAATGGMNGFVRFAGPLSTTRYKSFHGHLNYAHDTVGWIFVMRGCLYRNTSAVNALRFIPGSGNIASGTIRIYGFAK